jgi:hypothetical protein
MGDLNATSSIDAIIASYDAISLTIYITLAVILVAVIALGSEFWVNLWGIIIYPSMTFQRLLGEAQWVPGIVVVAISGLSSAMIFLAYISDQKLTEWFTHIDAANNPLLGPIFSNLDNILGQVGWDKKLLDIFIYMQKNPFQAGTLAVIVPLAFLILWLLWGFAGQLASMIAGNKAGHGVSNLWSAVPYTFLVWILSTWLFMVSLYDHPTVRLLYWISVAYFFFEHIILMREHGRYNLQKAVMATVLTIPLVCAFTVILIVAGVFISIQLGNYIK